MEHAALLADLAQLLRKHGRGAFESLARDLSDPQFSAALADVLRASADAAPADRAQSRRKTVRTDRLEHLRIDLDHYAGDDATVLVTVVDEVLAGYAHLSLRDIKQLADRVGILLPKSLKSRRDALARLIRQSLEGPAAIRTEVAHELAAMSHGGEGSLEAWSQIIEQSRRDSSS